MSKWPLTLIFLILLSGCAAYKNRQNIFEGAGRLPANTLADIENWNLTKSGFFIQKAEIRILDEGKEQKLLGSLKFNRPGKYLFSIKSLTGLEAARIMITKDTVLINDRINKKLFYGSPENLGRIYGITFEMLPLMLGDIIGNQSYKSGKIECRNDRGKAESKIENRKITYEIDCRNSKILEADVLSEAGNEGLRFNMSKMSRDGDMFFPKQIEIEDLNKTTLIKINIDRIKFGDEGDIIFIPGNNYEKILLK